MTPRLYRASSFWVFLLLIPALLSQLGCKKDLLQWERVEQIGPYSDGRYNRIFFANNRLGFVVGGSRFLRTDMLITRDGGKTWEYRSFPEAGKSLYGIAANNSGAIYVIGFDGKMLYSEDEGRHWEFRQMRYLPFKGIAFNGNNEGIVVGGISFDQGFYYRINKEGAEYSYDSVGFEINDICMADGNTGYMAGYGVVLKTTDGGHSWEFTPLNNDNFTAIYCLDPQHVWVCGNEGSIFKSADAGAHWERLRNGNDLKRKKYRLFDIVFSDAQHGYAVGEKGTVLYSDDGGKHWMELESFTESTLRSIAIAPDGSLLVVGDNGAFFRLRR